MTKILADGLACRTALGSRLPGWIRRDHRRSATRWPVWWFVAITAAGLVVAVLVWEELSAREQTYAERIIAADLGQVQSEIQMAVEARVIPLTYAAHVWEPWKQFPTRDSQAAVSRPRLYVTGYRSVG